jgi:membrane protein implicated in regulation of membrane protease activity
MTDFINLMFSPQNVLGTFFICFCTVYWLVVIVGAIDLELFDFDIEVDASDMDIEGSVDGGVMWFNKVLIFFNLGRIPFMVWLTFFSFPLWFMLLLVNEFFGNTTFALGLVFFIPLAMLSAVVAKPLTYPFVKIFEKLEEENKPKDLIGKIGTVVLAGREDRKGQIEIDYDGSPIRIYVWPSSKIVKLKKNESVLVIEKSRTEDQVYIVEPYDNSL